MYSDVLIIGAGPCGLACAARLREPTPSSLFTDAEHARYWDKRSNLNGRKETPEGELNRFRYDHQSKHSPRGSDSSASSGRSVSSSRRSSIGAGAWSVTSPSNSASNSPSTSTSLSASNCSPPRHGRPTSTARPRPSIRILDAHSPKEGAFMSRWNALFSSLNITSLRSPLFFHPDPRDRDGLLAYAYETGREGELKEVEMGSKVDLSVSRGGGGNFGGKEEKEGRQVREEPGMKMKAVPGAKGGYDEETEQSQELPEASLRRHSRRKRPSPRNLRLDARDHLLDYLTPSTALFRDYCASIAQRYHLTDTVQQARVVSVRYGTNNGASGSAASSPPEVFTITTADSQTYTARAVIVATGSTALPTPPTLPPDHNLLLTASSRAHATHVFAPGGLALPSSLLVKLRHQHRHQHRQQQPQQHAHATARTRTSALVVGGGLTAAQVAANLLCPPPSSSTSPAVPGLDHVHLVLRSRYKLKPFDVDLSWVAASTTRNERMAREFWGADSDAARAEILRDAKGGGSVSPGFDRAVVRRLVREGRLTVWEETRIGRGVWDGDGGSWRVVLQRKGADEAVPVGGRESPVGGFESPAPAAGESAEADDSRATEPPPPNSQQTVLHVDHIFFATGAQPDARTLPFLLQEGLPPMQTISGLPVLTADLAHSAAVPLFFTGALAALRLGPGAANLAGARSGAERVVRGIEELFGRRDGAGGRECGKRGRSEHGARGDEIVGGEDGESESESESEGDWERLTQERSSFTGGWANQFDVLSHGLDHGH